MIGLFLGSTDFPKKILDKIKKKKKIRKKNKEKKKIFYNRFN